MVGFLMVLRMVVRRFCKVLFLPFFLRATESTFNTSLDDSLIKVFAKHTLHDPFVIMEVSAAAICISFYWTSSAAAAVTSAVSNFQRPHTRLHPRDFLQNSTPERPPFLHTKVKSEWSRRSPLATPSDCSLPGSFHPGGIFQQVYWRGLTNLPTEIWDRSSLSHS